MWAELSNTSSGKETEMKAARLEHANITVENPDATAERLRALFGWEVRWRGVPGEGIHGGYTLHVGETDSYLAVYAKGPGAARGVDTYATLGGLNHVGVVVDDLDAVEKRVIAMGYTPHSHGDYEPGRRFYFDDADGIEFEVVSYA